VFFDVLSDTLRTSPSWFLWCSKCVCWRIRKTFDVLSVCRQVYRVWEMQDPFPVWLLLFSPDRIPSINFARTGFKQRWSYMNLLQFIFFVSNLLYSC
jgi:hypothetical protein